MNEITYYFEKKSENLKFIKTNLSDSLKRKRKTFLVQNYVFIIFYGRN